MTRTMAMAAVLAVALVPAQAQAQLMGAKALKVGVAVKGTPGTRPVADLYYLVGDVGARETYTLTVKGPASITLFAPDGSELLSSSGNGKVALDAVLNFTDVFVLAISRVDPRQPYTLSRKTTVPTFAEAMLASYAGYERSSDKIKEARCWLKPGVKLRHTTPQFVRTITLAADRTTLIVPDDSAKGAKGFEQTFRLETFQYHMSVKTPDGRVKEYSIAYPERGYGFRTGDHPQFKGYLCDR